MDAYRLFFVYRVRDLHYVYAHGMDMKEKRLFTVLLYAPNGIIDLQQTPHVLPLQLLTLLEAEKKNIEAGVYDLARWEPTSFHQAANE
ncbi:hypothetical protein A374_07979 [Fictibacillus macauensis ZFHKF-1]|uniref:Uncharacterized protein n=1 Tax=Fictibacillus macauensis ZFHKF-1 TaxID=1196324 RepID=I8AJ00_9BACL|nr:hypothetical protein [Fictibacillus macauensis]EIT85757.1 hypothetical protein A374_07979 [Fictibacillus macauensis ZFHKF-1]